MAPWLLRGASPVSPKASLIIAKQLTHFLLRLLLHQHITWNTRIHSLKTMIEERRKLGELQEIQSQIREEQALDDRAQELDRQAQAALKEREVDPISYSTATAKESSTRIGRGSAYNIIHRRSDHRASTCFARYA
ncbi:unnamed protein product [Arctogadus glacialis]